MRREFKIGLATLICGAAFLKWERMRLDANYKVLLGQPIVLTPDQKRLNPFKNLDAKGLLQLRSDVSLLTSQWTAFLQAKTAYARAETIKVEYGGNKFVIICGYPELNAPKVDVCMYEEFVAVWGMTTTHFSSENGVVARFNKKNGGLLFETNDGCTLAGVNLKEVDLEGGCGMAVL